MSNFYEAGKAAMTSNKDDWETPQALFDELDATHRFTLDPCSTHENAKCERHYTVEENGLAMPWSDETVFCNPPYGRGMKEWMRKCAEESRGGGAHRRPVPGAHGHGVVLGLRRAVRQGPIHPRQAQVRGRRQADAVVAVPVDAGILQPGRR